MLSYDLGFACWPSSSDSALDGFRISVEDWAFWQPFGRQLGIRCRAASLPSARLCCRSAVATGIVFSLFLTMSGEVLAALTASNLFPRSSGDREFYRYSDAKRAFGIDKPKKTKS
jgi:hypothetical protein